MTTSTQELFFPPFTGPESDRIFNLLVNSNTFIFGIRGFFLDDPLFWLEPPGL